MNRIELFNDHFQNYKVYGIPKAQLIIADIPYNVGNNAYGSNPSWYVDGDNKNGESDLAGKTFFDTDVDFRIPEFLHFCSKMLVNEPKEKGKAPCMIVFCSFEQQFQLIEEAKKHGLNNYLNLVFRKNFSAQVLKANMRVVGNCEYAILLYREKLPKFNNGGNMIFNCMDWPRETGNEKIHPTQKPVALLERLIEIFTDENEVVIDPCAGSGSTLVAAKNMNRKAYGFEIKKNFFGLATKWIESVAVQKNIFCEYEEKKYKQKDLL
jgi:site-specific DNA-methyltransferase (adenine-specific)